MRKTRFLLALGGLLAAVTPLTGGAFAQPDMSLTSTLTLTTQPPTQPWETEFEELLRRLRVKLGNPGPGSPLKEVALGLNIQLMLFGLPEGLTAQDLAELEADAIALRDCATGETKPPLGTEFALVVMLHDLGNDLLKRIDRY